MSSRPAVKSAFENLRPTILREPTRSTISAEAEARLLERPRTLQEAAPLETLGESPLHAAAAPERMGPMTSPFSSATTLLQKKKKERLLLVSFRMPEGLKEKLEQAAKRHEVNQTDLINEAIALNLQRYL